MNRHRPFLELAATAIDYPLEMSERRHLDEHLTGCRECARAMTALGADAAAIGSLPPVRLAERRGDQILAAALRPAARRTPAPPGRDRCAAGAPDHRVDRRGCGAAPPRGPGALRRRPAAERNRLTGARRDLEPDVEPGRELEAHRVHPVGQSGRHARRRRQRVGRAPQERRVGDPPCRRQRPPLAHGGPDRVRLPAGEPGLPGDLRRGPDVARFRAAPRCGGGPARAGAQWPFDRVPPRHDRRRRDVAGPGRRFRESPAGGGTVPGLVARWGLAGGPTGVAHRAGRDRRR